MVGKTTTRKRDSLIQMFLDGTADEVYADGRLKTRQSGDTIELIAYHREKIAEYHEASGQVTVFAGHHGNVSQTVTRYVSRVVNLAGERNGREVILTELAPNTRLQPAAEAAQFIGEYVGFGRPMSDAERKAVDTVNRNLRRLL